MYASLTLAKIEVDGRGEEDTVDCGSNGGETIKGEGNGLGEAVEGDKGNFILWQWRKHASIDDVGNSLPGESSKTESSKLMYSSSHEVTRKIISMNFIWNFKKSHEI